MKHNWQEYPAGKELHQTSSFSWHYDEQEICYFLEGSVVVTPENGEPVQISKGDLVIFPEGMDCMWEIKEPVRKHYLFG